MNSINKIFYRFNISFFYVPTLKKFQSDVLKEFFLRKNLENFMVFYILKKKENIGKEY